MVVVEVRQGILTWIIVVKVRQGTLIWIAVEQEKKEEDEDGEDEEEVIDIKCNNPHLAGGEKYFFCLIYSEKEKKILYIIFTKL